MSPRQLISRLLDRKTALRAYISRRTRSRGEVADLVQETYLRMLRSGAATIEDPERYLLAVAGNLVREHALMTVRREQRETVTDPGQLPECAIGIDYTDDLHLEDVKARLGRVVSQLPARYQLVLSMTYEDGLSQLQIAQQLKISRSMVQKILTKAHAHCRTRMAPGGRK